MHELGQGDAWEVLKLGPESLVSIGCFAWRLVYPVGYGRRRVRQIGQGGRL